MDDTHKNVTKHLYTLHHRSTPSPPKPQPQSASDHFPCVWAAMEDALPYFPRHWLLSWDPWVATDMVVVMTWGTTTVSFFTQSARQQALITYRFAFVSFFTQLGSRSLSEICVNWRKTLRILHQWYDKCVQHNLELVHKAKMMELMIYS